MSQIDDEKKMNVLLNCADIAMGFDAIDEAEMYLIMYVELAQTIPQNDDQRRAFDRLTDEITRAKEMR